MNVNELITLFRRDTEEATYTYDRNLPDSFSIWSNYQLINYLNQVQNEFATRTYCLKDSNTFEITLIKDDSWIDIDPVILKVERVESLTSNRILPVVTMEEFIMNTFNRSWETKTGVPEYCISDIETDRFRVYPIPEEDNTIKLTVRRLPLEDLSSIDDELEINRKYHYGLLHGIKSLAYSNPKAILAGFAPLQVLERNNWEDFLLRSTRDFKVKTRGPGKIRYGGL